MKDKKKFVLNLLQQQKQPVGLKNLMESLPPNFAERTVRRWLNEMLKEGSLVKTGQKKSTLYQANPSHTSHFHFGAASQKAIAYVTQAVIHRDPVTYHQAWFDAYRPNDTFYLDSNTRNHLAKKGKRTIDHDPAGTFAKKIYNRLLIDLSYNSSRLEGNTYSLLETKQLILEGKEAEGKLSMERVMILNHKEAIRYLVDNVDKITVSYDVICTLHYLLSDGLVSPEYSGKVRDHGVRISASTYMPLETKTHLEKTLVAIGEKAHAIEDPFEQSFFLLAHIAYLQSFIDVNKRTGRLSANIPLIQYNLVPLSFKDIEKDDYTNAMLSLYELNDLSPLIELYYLSYMRGCQEYDIAVDIVGFDEVRIRYRALRRALISRIIKEVLLGDALKKCLSETVRSLPESDQVAFQKTIEEDLAELNPARLVGLGVSIQEWQHWLEENLEQ